MKQSQQVLEWQAQARAEAQLETLRGILVRLLQLRCKTEIPADLHAPIESTTDATELSRWVDVAATVDSLEAFRAALKA